MDNQLYCLQGKGVKIPVKLQIFKHGGGIYLAFVGEGVHIPLAANAEIIAAELRQALALIEQASATNDQGYINYKPSHPERNAPNWDWLTPEMVIKYFEQSPILAVIADDVRAILKKSWGTGDTAIAPAVPSQLELDLETIRPHLEKITAGGKINKSEIARVLGIKASGPSAWRRVTAIAQSISSSSEEELRSAEMGQKRRSAAA